MSRTFSINHIDFLLSPEQISNSKTLQIIVDHSSKKKIDVKLPKSVQNITKNDLKNILYILGLPEIEDVDDKEQIDAFIKHNLSDTVMTCILERYNLYSSLLKYLNSPHDLKYIINRYVELRIESQRIDAQFLISLSKSVLIDKVQNLIRVDQIPHLLRWRDMGVMSMMTFVKILGMVRPEDRYQFIDISSLKLKRLGQDIDSDDPESNQEIVFDPQIAIKKLDDFSFNVLDADFMNQIDHKHVFFAGGSLISCYEEQQHDWSDIDLWVNADDKMSVLLNTFKLLSVLKEAFERHGYDKLLWSCSNNVVTCYCVGYNRNIQIVMVKGDPSKNVDGFDFDYVKAYMKNHRIYGSIAFIKSFVEKKICDVVVEKLKEFRVVKSLIKGYRFSDELMQNPIINDAVTRYNEYKRLEQAGYQICPQVVEKKEEQIKHNNKDDEDLVDMMIGEDNKPPARQITDVICKTRNKFYYPSETDYDEFANRLVPYHQSRAYYMINTMCGHKIVSTDLNDIEKYLSNVINSDKGFEFTTQYTAEEREAYNKIKKIDDIDLDNMYLQTNIYIGQSPQIRVPVMYQVDGVATKFEFVTDELVLDSDPFERFNEKFYRSENDPKLFNLRLRKMRNKPNHPEIDKIFGLIDIFDTSLKDLFNEPFVIRNTETDKDVIIRGCEYNSLIKRFMIDDEDSDDEGMYRKKQKDNANDFVKFHLNVDRESKLLTEIYNKGQKVDIIQLPDLRNVVKYKSRVIIKARFEHLAISKGQPKMVFPKLFVTRIDVL